MTLDPLLLSRLQFAWLIAWHILLPALTIGLASYIALLEGIYFVTARDIWLRLSSFWTRIFAIAFGMGVVSGVAMPFQFGTNWSRFSDATANIISPMLASPLGFIAVIAGWTTEVGRQPWTVYGVMRTADSVTPSLTGLDVLISLTGYVLV